MPLVEQELRTLFITPGTTPGFSGARVSQSLVFCVVFCISLFVFTILFLSLYCIVFPLFTAPDYLFVTFKLFLLEY